MDPDRRLLGLLADGALHSGQELARKLDVTRAAVWKRVRILERRGVPVERARGRGYRLSQAMDLLDQDAILRRLPAPMRGRVRMDVRLCADSTNRIVLDANDCDGLVVLAEYQSAGRGRRGKRWLSPLGSGICLSLGWRLDPVPAGAGALSILAGAAVVRALERAGARGLGVKWPNDVVCDHGKVGGLLIESRAQLGGAMEVVIGVGINVQLPGTLIVNGDNRPADLAACCPRRPERSALAALLVEALMDMLSELAAGRTAAYLDLWRARDVGVGREARLHVATGTLHGRVLGISDAGLLRLDLGGAVREFASGDLSLRLR
jgi:BirA family biotin operon repressor/biotin-[acetyl-CoA-carboxylase] ligase